MRNNNSCQNDKLYNNITNEDTPDEYWYYLLYAVLNDLPVKEWNDFSRNLMYKNRFTNSHRIVDVIKNQADERSLIIGKNQKLYRARIYNQDPLKVFLADVFRNNDINTDNVDYNSEDIDDFFISQFTAVLMAIEKKTKKGEAIIKLYNKWKRKKFRGYNADESGKPPSGGTSAGRLNPERISYLYLAEDCRTAVYEVRPTIGQHVSVATFKTLDNIRVYDMTANSEPQDLSKNDDECTLFKEIQKRFSMPNAGDSFEYLPTQYLGEVIKLLGFDGIRFGSSLRRDGVNIVLFDDKKCKAIGSDIIRVDGIELEFGNPDIYEFEKVIE